MDIGKYRGKQAQDLINDKKIYSDSELVWKYGFENSNGAEIQRKNIHKKIQEYTKTSYDESEYITDNGLRCLVKNQTIKPVKKGVYIEIKHNDDTY